MRPATVLLHMGQQYFCVDGSALGGVANRFDDAAELIGQAARTPLSRLRFDGSAAGRAHTGQGDALRRALERWAAELVGWSRASAEIAAALRAGAQRYREAELCAADRIG